MVRVALDLLGGDRAPESVVEGALLALAADPDLEVLLVGPVDVAERLLAGRCGVGRPGAARYALVAASQVVEMDEDPARAVRAKRDATVRVAARLVRDGRADAVVSIGSTGAALAAAIFTMGRLRGMSRPGLAIVVPARAGHLVLLDAGATTEASPELLAQFALAGVAFAQVRLGLPRPRVGLLSNGEEAGKGDPLRKAAFEALSALPVDFVGNVEGGDVPEGGPADVVVTDGFTGNVLLKGLEGAAAMVTATLLDALRATPDGAAATFDLMPVLTEVAAALLPEDLGGGVLLGVDGVVVVGHGSSTPRAVASCVRVAAQTAREGVVPALKDALAALAAKRETVEEPA